MWSAIRELGSRAAQALGIEVPELPAVQDTLQDTVQQVGEAAEPVATQAQETAQSAADQVTGAGESAAEGVTDAAAAIEKP